MDRLPTEIKWKMMVEMALVDVDSLCTVDSTFADIYNDERLWKARLNSEIPEVYNLADVQTRFDYITALRYMEYIKWASPTSEKTSFTRFKSYVLGNATDLDEDWYNQPKYSAKRWLKLYGQVRSLTDGEKDIFVPQLKRFNYNLRRLHHVRARESDDNRLDKTLEFMYDVYNLDRGPVGWADGDP